MVHQFSAVLEKIFHAVVNKGRTSKNRSHHDKGKYLAAEEPDGNGSFLEEEGDKFDYILKRVLIHFETH